MKKPKIDNHRNERLALSILILVPFIVFYRTLSFDFSPMDEQWLIVRKFNYLKDWNNLWRAFKDPVADVYYRPILTISFIVDAHLGGLKPLVYHLTNLILHLSCVVLLYRFLLKLKTSFTAAFLFSLLFAIHPALTHAVVWVPGRNDVLLCFFSLLSFNFLLKYIESRSIYAITLHFLFFICALFSKETAVILPLVYISLLYCCLELPNKKQYFIPAIGWLVISLSWFFIKNSVLTTSSLPNNKDFLVVLQNMVPGFLIYIGKILWPFSASVTPTVQNSSLIAGVVTLGLLIGLTFLLGLKHKKIAGLGILLFFVGLALPIFFGASSILGEHYEHRIYLPFVGFILFASQLQLNFNKSQTKTIFITLLIALVIKTFMRSETYSSGLNYVNEGIEDSPKNYVFHFLKGNILYNAHQLDAALLCFNKAIELQPNRIQSLANRANVYTEMGEKELAIADLDAALKLGSNANIFLNKTVTYYRFQDFENALINFRILTQFGDNYVALLPTDILKKMAEMDQQSQALKHVEKLNRDIMADPANATAHLRAESQKNLEALNNAIKGDPTNAVFYVHRAKCLVDLRNWNEALSDLKKACDLDPDNKEYPEFYKALKNSMPH